MGNLSEEYSYRSRSFSSEGISSSNNIINNKKEDNVKKVLNFSKNSSELSSHSDEGKADKKKEKNMDEDIIDISKENNNENDNKIEK